MIKALIDWNILLPGFLEEECMEFIFIALKCEMCACCCHILESECMGKYEIGGW